MKQIFTLTLGSLFIFAAHASQNSIQNNEYPYIQPVAVEKAPTKTNSPTTQNTKDANVHANQDLSHNQMPQDSFAEPDSDADGVIDSEDRCPNTSKEFVVDGYGCPQTANLQIRFQSGKYDVDDSLLQQIKSFALFLKENKGYQVVIYGYTDNSGDPKANKILSQKRAEAVKEGLIRYEINETRLTSIGMGDKNPIADNSTPQGRAQNRRIEVELIQ